MSGRVVVGVDGSEAAMDAVRWAAREAKLRGMKLELVSAWETPIYDHVGVYGFTIPDDMTKGLAQYAEDIVSAAAREARAEAQDIDVEPFTAEGRAAKVLLEVASGADLLVVGSRGRGGFRELLLGSVSQQCAQHATCPVVIIQHVAHEVGTAA